MRDFNTSMEQLERCLVEDALIKSRGNRTEAAKLLGLNRSTLVMKMRRLELMNRDYGQMRENSEALANS